MSIKNISDSYGRKRAYLFKVALETIQKGAKFVNSKS